MFLHNAAGRIGTHTYWVKVDGVSEGFFYPVMVAGLMNIGGGYQDGWIIFCHSRQGGDAVFKWWIKTILIPFVVAVRADLVEGGESPGEPAVVYCDGEFTQLNTILHPDMLALITDANIICGKSPASTSSKLQASDVGPIFMASKMVLCSMNTGAGYRRNSISR